MAKTKQHNLRFATKAIHAGQESEQITGAVSVPIFQTSTYSNIKIGVKTGYDYARTDNPTRTALQKCLAELENGKYAYCYSSGLAAVHAVINLLKAGDHVVCSENVYGGTYRLFEQIMTNYGLEFTFVDTSDFRNVEKAVKPNTKLLYAETPTNPMLGITDLKKFGAFGRKKKIMTGIDNTFMSPYFQNPLDFGIDIVLHSSTKYLNGHCDVVGGCVITSDKSIAERIKFIQNAIGAVPAPMDCFLILRALKTLPLRMKAHEENTELIAKFLGRERKVRKIYYPGLKTHPNHKIAKAQARGFGGMISIDLGSFSKAKRFCNALKIFLIAESLGGVESLVCHPPSMTHGSVPKKMREKIGLSDGLVRLSVGIEDVNDLLEDIKHALKKI